MPNLKFLGGLEMLSQMVLIFHPAPLYIDLDVNSLLRKEFLTHSQCMAGFIETVQLNLLISEACTTVAV